MLSGPKKNMIENIPTKIFAHNLRCINTTHDCWSIFLAVSWNHSICLKRTWIWLCLWSWSAVFQGPLDQLLDLSYIIYIHSIWCSHLCLCIFWICMNRFTLETSSQELRSTCCAQLGGATSATSQVNPRRISQLSPTQRHCLDGFLSKQSWTLDDIGTDFI